MKEFNQRLIVSSIAITIVAFLITFSQLPFVGTLLALTVAALAGIGVWEYAQMTSEKGLMPAVTQMIVVAVCVVLAFYVSLVYPHWSKFAVLTIVLGFVSFFVAHFKKTDDALLLVAVEFFGVCYLAVPFSFMLAILYPTASDVDGRWWLFYLIAVTKITDIGGYFVGKLFGQRPLAKHLSPRKTIEGAVGGFLFAIGLSLVFSFIGHLFKAPTFNLGLMDAIWMGMVIGILAQVGDLAESLLKRDAFVKDSNKLPGVGGILDMVDSLLFTSPVVYFFIHG
jgi:phosphatidate cytidylyltransferase